MIVTRIAHTPVSVTKEIDVPAVVTRAVCFSVLVTKQKGHRASHFVLTGAMSLYWVQPPFPFLIYVLAI